MRKALSDTAIRAMQSPPKGYRILWDALPGFGCRISQAGTRAFVVLVASGRPQTIGRYPALSLADARKEAKKLLARKTLGAKHPVRTAWDDAVAQFLAECAKRLKPRTLRDYARLLRHFPFARQPVAAVTSSVIGLRLQPLPRSEQGHAAAVVRLFLNWCRRNHLMDRSPIEDMAIRSPGSVRTRVLTDDEVKAVWHSVRASTGSFERIVALLILTGQRRGEIAALQWDWIKGDSIEFPIEISKNRQAWVIPIGPVSQALLAAIPRVDGSPYVFPALRQKSSASTTFNGWGKPKARFDKKCGVTGWTLHDLRRTFATNMQRLGVRLEVTEALLNHVSGTRAGIVGIYQRYHYLPEMREAALRWERYLTTLI